MRTYIQQCWYILFITLFFNSCLKLDPFLFKKEGVSEYLLYNYNEKTECSDALTYLDAQKYPRAVTREISMKSGNETIYAVLLTDSSASVSSDDTIILYFHGTSKHIDHYWKRACLLHATGYPVLIVDYRGYGKSTGDPTEDGIYMDGRTAYEYIRDSLGNPQVIVYAYSLATLVGCDVAGVYKPDRLIKLILEAAIGSVETMVEDASYLNLPGNFLTTIKGDNKEKIKNVYIPLLWMHGTKDETLNRETNGVPVWNNYPGISGYYIIASGAGHTDIPQILSYDRYLKCLKDFIKDNSVKDPFLLPKKI